MTERCPRCGNPVYFAEEVRALGKKWHKLCMKCSNCNKLLDSTTCTEHDGDAFCKSCYGKLFGPKGYGFAGGSSGLSMDTGNPYEQTRSNVSHIAQAQGAPFIETSKPKWGGTDGCPRCQKPVYFAEEVRAMGKKWHKLCLACAKCNKLLDSTTCNDHDGEVFCKACYGKSFGPKGYGFAGGASGLSMDTGVRNQISTENVSHLAQAQAAPLVNGSNGAPPKKSWGGTDACPRCGKAVYFAEEARALGKKFHKLCLKCANCNKGLDSTTCTDHEDEIYCRTCHGKLFGPKGYGFAAGASGLSMDTGRPNEVSRENVSTFALAQAAPLLENGGGEGKKKPTFGGADVCPRCGKQVYFAEKVMGGGNIYHKACFKCTACNKSLDSTTMTQSEGDVFCKACYGKYFGPKGFGFGQALQHTA
ncbi:hypothetical protein FSP39_022365 [Pinctada imbricata]|uniref:Cysteine-rich protein 1 n=1 Tax=Pinctada imbricata TaxID=66713 RepID=A0AA88YLN1_PINIB|nr:hypothetical protein FSP39_022365 [Pinctada imbricata]